MAAPEGARVGVLGATGAVGTEAVALLSRSPAVAEVVALTRRARGPGGFPGAAEGRVAERVVTFGSLQPADLAGLDAVVCCLGTTAADAGGAAQRHVIDHDYVLEAARLARAEPRCQYFSLLTSAGASSKSLLSYPRTKGQVEEGVEALRFPRTAVWRPGLLDRGDRARGVERAGLALAGGVPVRSLAGAMVAELERQAAAAPAPDASAAPARDAFSDADIRRLARASGFEPASPASCAIV